jgi:hypothetical protein
MYYERDLSRSWLLLGPEGGGIFVDFEMGCSEKMGTMERA